VRLLGCFGVKDNIDFVEENISRSLRVISGGFLMPLPSPGRFLGSAAAAHIPAKQTVPQRHDYTLVTVR